MTEGAATTEDDEEEHAPRSATAGDAYSELIGEQLAEERERKTSLEQRGLAVITTAGVLVSLLLGLAAVVTSAKGFAVPDLARYLLAVALALFLGAAVTGIVTNWPRKYIEVADSDLERLTQPNLWEGPVLVGSRRAAEVRVMILRKARAINRAKARVLNWAMVLEVAAVAVVAVSVAVILLDS